MGLDMYLNRKTYVQRWDHIPPERQFSVTVKRGGKPYKDIDPEKVSYVIEQVAYWRKANQIHKWFVDHVQDGKDDCGDYYVSREQLKELHDTCEAVLADHDRAAKLLPPQSGFFFGDTDLDEYYFKDLADTVRQIKPLLTGYDDASYEYNSSW